MDEPYRLASEKGAVGTATGSAILYACECSNDTCHFVDLKFAGKPPKDWRFAVQGDWDPVPRVAKQSKNKWVVDVNGDGTDDTITKSSKTGKDKDGETVTTVTHTLEMNGKRIRIDESELNGVYASKVEMEIADLNGDGVLDFLFTVSGHNVSTYLVDVATGKREVVASHYAGD